MRSSSARYPAIRTLFIDELLETLENREPDSPLAAALAPLNDPLPELEKEAAQHYHQIWKGRDLDQEDREVLTEIFLNLLLQRFKTKSREEIRTMIAELTPLRETRVAQEFLEEGIQRGLEQGLEEGIERGTANLIRRMAAKGKTPEEIAELTDLPVEEVHRLLTFAVE